MCTSPFKEQQKTEGERESGKCNNAQNVATCSKKMSKYCRGTLAVTYHFACTAPGSNYQYKCILLFFPRHWWSACLPSLKLQLTICCLSTTTRHFFLFFFYKPTTRKNTSTN